MEYFDELNGAKVRDKEAREEIEALKNAGGGKLYMHLYTLRSHLSANGMTGKYFSKSNQPLTTLFRLDNPEDGAVDIAKLKNIIKQTIWERYFDADYEYVVPIVSIDDGYIYDITGVGVMVGQTDPSCVNSYVEVGVDYAVDFEILDEQIMEV